MSALFYLFKTKSKDKSKKNKWIGKTLKLFAHVSSLIKCQKHTYGSTNMKNFIFSKVIKKL